MGGKGSGGHNETPESKETAGKLRKAFGAGSPPPQRAVERAKSKGGKAIRRINSEKQKRGEK